MGKTSPSEFISQVKQEVTRVTWPSRKETIASTVMVLIMVLIISTFFFFVDFVITNIVQLILGL